jgi:hypothetical protein
MKAFAGIGLAVVLGLFAINAVQAQPPAILLAMALLLGLLSIGHSVMGERLLINPLLKLADLPAPRGSVQRTRIILRAAWHGLSLLWSCLAGALVWMHLMPGTTTAPFLWMLVWVFGLSGAIILVATKGGHTSWVHFLLVAALAAWQISLI